MKAVAENPEAFADHVNFMDTDRPTSPRVYVVDERIAGNNGLRMPALEGDAASGCDASPL